jgi:hypothetical protein
MMKTTNQSPRCARASSSVLRYSTVLLLGAALVAAQGRAVKPPVQTKQTSGNHPHVATLRSSDSSEGSRVALSSDQSLNDYEAYRRGDRFYIKIPATDVPRAEALRGRGFADVKVQRSGDSTIISFRLPPGASAHVEQRGNRLEVVFTVAGAGSSIVSSTGRETPRSPSGAGSNRNSNVSNRSASPLSANKSAPLNRNSNAGSRATAPASAKPASANKNSAERSSSATARNTGNSNLAGKSGPAAALAANSKPVATPLPSPIRSLTAKPTPTPAQKFSATPFASPTTQPTPLSAANSSRPDRWGGIKERINYWILLAQLNPIPVVTGAVVLLLLIALLLFQRRRAKSPRRVRSGITKSTKSKSRPEPSRVPPLSESKSAPEVSPAVAEMAAVAAVAPKSEAAVEKVEPGRNAEASLAEDPRRQRIAQVNEEAQKLINGGSYDENIIGSSNPETRQLVGAELLAAIVGRSATRREHARAAFMKHGYFDDATRDLRIAGSANERAAAARRLSFVHNNEATPHLVGALEDPSPDVRRAAVEALMDLRDPAAIGPLNSLMQTENDRKVPRTLIKHAIDACATAPLDEAPSVAGPKSAPDSLPEPASHQTETEREVIEL